MTGSKRESKGCFDVTYMYNNFLHSRFIVLKYSDDEKGRK